MEPVDIDRTVGYAVRISRERPFAFGTLTRRLSVGFSPDRCEKTGAKSNPIPGLPSYHSYVQLVEALSAAWDY